MIALAGNKADLASSRMVEYEEAKQYADENGLLFMETSAKTALNVNEIFLAIGETGVKERGIRKKGLKILKLLESFQTRNIILNSKATLIQLINLSLILQLKNYRRMRAVRIKDRTRAGDWNRMNKLNSPAIAASDVLILLVSNKTDGNLMILRKRKY